MNYKNLEVFKVALLSLSREVLNQVLFEDGVSTATNGRILVQVSGENIFNKVLIWAKDIKSIWNVSKLKQSKITLDESGLTIKRGIEETFIGASKYKVDYPDVDICKPTNKEPKLTIILDTILLKSLLTIYEHLDEITINIYGEQAPIEILGEDRMEGQKFYGLLMVKRGEPLQRELFYKTMNKRFKDKTSE